jgi:D-alanine transaminase
MNRTVYVNGEFLPEADGKISIFDRGFLFADGVYEVTAVVNGKLVDYEPHMERLQRSLRELDMDAPCTQAELRNMHEGLIAKNELTEGWVYMQVSRGAADRDFKFPKGVEPTLVGFTQTKNIMDNPDGVTGVKVCTVPDIRWARRDIKSVMLLAPVLGKQAAHEKGCFEGWMVEDGKVTEGTSSNAYIIKDNVIITRGISHAILNGITRKVLFALCAETGITIEERAFTPEEAYGADEAFLTSSSNFVLPIVEIDGKRVGGGQPGPLSRRLRDMFLENVKAQTSA